MWRISFIDINKFQTWKYFRQLSILKMIMHFTSSSPLTKKSRGAPKPLDYLSIFSKSFVTYAFYLTGNQWGRGDGALLSRHFFVYALLSTSYIWLFYVRFLQFPFSNIIPHFFGILKSLNSDYKSFNKYRKVRRSPILVFNESYKC